VSSPHPDLRRGVPSDLDAILALDRATENAPHWPAAVYAAMLDAPDIGPASATPLHHSDAPRRCLLVAEANTSLVAFAVAMVHPSPGETAPPHPQSTPERLAELETVVVATSARRSGIGRALCRALLDWCKSQGATGVVLEVRAASTAAIALYSGLGFKQLGQRPGYYRDPEDNALVMRLHLD
jgi:[ribosomal protein S18]-alanine N-acetyltransferase